jgi:hypothetical protein
VKAQDCCDQERYFDRHADVPGVYSGGWYDPFAVATTTYYAAMARKNFNLTGVGEPERLDGRRVSANLFDLLGVQPRLGRGFLPQEDTPGTHVVILSHGLWQRRFGSDPRIIGQAVNLNGKSYSVVGVMPRALACQAAATGRTSFGFQLHFAARKRGRALTTSKSSRG